MQNSIPRFSLFFSGSKQVEKMHPDKRNIFGNIREFIEGGNPGILLLIPAIIFILLIISWDSLSNTIFSHNPPEAISYLFLGITFLIGSLMFLVIIVRKEYLWIIPIKGKLAVIFGWFWFTGAILLGLAMIIKAVILFLG
jgi:hypothetical protein